MGQNGSVASWFFHRFSIDSLNRVNPERSSRTPSRRPEAGEWGLYRCRVTGQPPKLFILPHAGGSAEFYVPFAKAFASDIKRVAVRYPGRGGNHDLGSFT